ncbi:hypothetical protein PVAND_009900 [Polypedilum vanderplanki]|uniref:COMM domain-containing protein n=1 Tax=Polypedilum vanderplanki TaxID=319348 RepID=A0A9J6CEP3_POLVA|nr:hypothetical protein PVAND_009900 [Polypedilum vanderplanki]
MVFSVDHKNSLIKLKDLSLSSLKILLENLKSFDIETEENQEYYHSLLKLNIESHKLKLSEREITQLLKDELGFSEEQTKLVNEYISDQNEIFVDDSLRFVDLEWRLEAAIHRRTLHNINPIKPKILLKMNVDGESSYRYRSKIPSNQQIVMTTNATNLVHIIQKLEQALVDSKSLIKK